MIALVVMTVLAFGLLVALEICPPRDDAKGLEAEILRTAIEYSGCRLGVIVGDGYGKGNVYCIVDRNGLSMSADFKYQKVELYPAIGYKGPRIVELSSPDSVQELGHIIRQSFRYWQKYVA